MNPFAGAQKMYPLSPIRDAVEQAVSTENLKAIASKTNDPELLLGFALMAQAGNPLRKELLAQAVQAKAEHGPIAAVLPVMLDAVDKDSVSELIQRETGNALGHYLQGNLLYHSDRKAEALESFRSAARCPELSLYDATTAGAIFKALDALQLKGEDRLCALCWMAARMFNFTTSALQPLRNSLTELAAGADVATRKEISDLLLVLAGHLFATNYVNRWHGERALEVAFQMKAEVAAAENSPTMYGYGAATQLSVHAICTWPGFENLPRPEQLAQFLPSRIYRTFVVVDPDKFNARHIGELNFHVSETNRAAFEKAKDNWIKAARALLDVALTDPDRIIGAYLKGILPGREGRWPWFPPGTYVGELLQQMPDLFRAAAANEEAMMALWRVGDTDPDRQNISRMMKLAWALYNYASAHEDRFPDSLDALLKDADPKEPLEIRSLLTGKPYVYVAAGQKRPAKAAERFEMILLYDDQPSEGDYHACVLVSCSGTHAPLQVISEQVRKRSGAIA